jgi:hypothetical protein
MAVISAPFWLISVLQRLNAHRRSRQMEALARSLGWGFLPGNDQLHGREFRFDKFQEGFACHTLKGSLPFDGRELRVKMGDFYRADLYSSYILVEAPFGTRGDLTIRFEGSEDRMMEALTTGADIDFESEEFSRRFKVTSSDKRFAYDVIDPRMMAFLMRELPPLRTELRDGWWCVTHVLLMSPDLFMRHLAWLQGFFDAWPDHLRTPATPIGARP